MPKHIRTVCLEFFGQARDAIPSIVEIKSYLESSNARGAILAGLEHLDERYLRAIGYSTKSKTRRAAENGSARRYCRRGRRRRRRRGIGSGTSRQRAPPGAGEGFIAVSDAARHQFWRDRAKTAAIAKHTNAFKINEDVVIPLERLGEYTDAVERINIELSIRNKLELLDALGDYFSGEIKPGKTGELDAGRSAEARELIARLRRRWRHLLEAMDTPLHSARAELAALGGRPADRRLGDNLRSAAGPQHSRQLENRIARRTGADIRRRRLRIGSPPNARRCIGTSCKDACSSPCTCMPATATCTRISR